jgi:hypothetical protein
MREFPIVYARSGKEKLLRQIARQTPEWIAVAKKRGKYWPVTYYLVPRSIETR